MTEQATEKEVPSRYSAFAALFAAVMMIIVTWFARQHAFESGAPGAYLLWFASGFIAVFVGLKVAKRIWPQHSPLLAAGLLAGTLVIMIAVGYRNHGMLAAQLFQYGPALLAALVVFEREWKKRKKEKTAVPLEPESHDRNMEPPKQTTRLKTVVIWAIGVFVLIEAILLLGGKWVLVDQEDGGGSNASFEGNRYYPSTQSWRVLTCTYWTGRSIQTIEFSGEYGPVPMECLFVTDAQ